jgi:hypothetical protein
MLASEARGERGELGHNVSLYMLLRSLVTLFKFMRPSNLTLEPTMSTIGRCRGLCRAVKHLYTRDDFLLLL